VKFVVDGGKNSREKNIFGYAGQARYETRQKEI